MKLSSHAVYWFFPFHFKQENEEIEALIPSLSLRDLRQADWVTSSVKDKHVASDSAELAWREEALALKSDLLPYVERLLGGQNADETGAQSLALAPLTLSDKAMGAIGKRRHNFGLGLSGSAVRRVGLIEGDNPDIQGNSDAAVHRLILPFKLESVRMFRFATGTGMLVIEVQYAKPEREDGMPFTCADECMPSVLLEGNHSLGHPARGGAFFWRANYALGGKADGYVASEALSLSSVAETLLIGIPGFKKAAGLSRLYSYTAAMIALAPEESLNEYACRVARRYTSDYSINLEGFAPFSPFQDIIHVAEYEGSASLVDESRQVEYLDQFIENSVKPTLLPMLLLAQHEHNFLLDLVDASSVGYLAERDEGKRAEFLLAQRARYLDYRLNYRFDNAARLSPQNGVYRLWRKALRVDEIAAGLDADLESIAAIEVEKHRVRLEREQEEHRASMERHEGIKRRYEMIKVAIMSGVSVYVIIQKIVDTVAPPLTSQIVACVAALLASGASLRFGRPVEMDEKIADAAELVKKEVDQAFSR